MINSNRFLLIICCLLICIPFITCGSIRNYLAPDGPEFSGSFGPDHETPTDTIKVVSFNIKLGEKIDQAIYELSETAELQDADFILLQEMDTEGTETVAKRLNYHYVYYPASVHKTHDKNFGNAILSKWPIKIQKKIILPHEHPHSEQRRIAVAATIDMGELEILIYSVHTETILLKRKKRLSQADSIASSVPKDFQHVIVGGDFNTGSNKSIEATERIFVNDGFIRATKDVGWTVKAGPFGLFRKRLDHIFTRGMTVIGAGKLEETKASDHRPIWVKLKIN